MFQANLSATATVRDVTLIIRKRETKTILKGTVSAKTLSFHEYSEMLTLRLLYCLYKGKKIAESDKEKNYKLKRLNNSQKTYQIEWQF